MNARKELKKLKKFIKWLYNNKEFYRIIIHDGWGGVHNYELSEDEALKIIDEYFNDIYN